MKKYLKKLGLLIPSLLLIVATITTITLGNKKVKEREHFSPEPIQSAMTVSGYLGSFDVVYTDENNVVITELSGVTKFNIFFYLTVQQNVSAYQIGWTFDSSQVSNVVAAAADIGDRKFKNIFKINSESDFPGAPGGSAEYAVGEDDDYNPTNFTSGANATGTTSSLLFTGTVGSSANVSAKTVCIGAAQITLATGKDSFTAECSQFVPGKNSGDNPSNRGPYTGTDLDNFDFSIGAGSLSDSTVVTGTIQGASETAARAVTVNATAGTITATVPACATTGTTATLKLEVADKGTLGAASGTGIAGTGGTYTVSFDNRGQIRTGTVTATAQDGTTTKNYNISVEWEKYDNRQLTGMSITSNQTSAYGVQFTQKNGSNDGTAISIPVSISSATTSVKFTPSFASNQGISVTVDGKNFTGTGVDVNVANGTNVNVVVTSEKGNSKTYTYQFTTITSDTTIKSISLSNNGSNLSETPTYNSVTGKWEVTVPYTENGSINRQITITPSVKSGNSYSPSPLTVSFADSDTSATTKTVQVTVRDATTGETQTWDIQITRAAADLDEGIDGSSVQVATDAAFTNTLPVTYNSATKTFVIDNMNALDYDIKQLYLKVNKNSATAVLYYANEGTSWNGTTAKTFSTGTGTVAADFQTTFKVKAKDATATSTYTVKGRRGPGDTNNGLNIVVKGASNGAVISQYTPTSPQIDHYYYSVKKSENSQVNFELTPMSNKATVEFSTGGNTYQTWEGAVASANYALKQVYNVKVTSQTGSSKIYYLHIEEADERDTTVTLDELYITYVDPATGNTVTPTEDTGKVFSKNNPSKYTYTVPFNAGEITIIYTPTNSAAHVYKSKNPISSNTAVTSINTSNITGSTTLSYWVQAENETWSSAAYQLEIKRQAGSAKALLDDFTINGTTVTGFTQTDAGGNYTVILPTGLNSVTLGFDPCQYAVATYGGTTTTGPNSYTGSLTLTNGKATASIVVKSQTGTVTNTFNLTVYSADQGHVLSELRVLDRDQSNITSGSGGETVGNPKVDLIDGDGNRVYTAGINPSDPSNIVVNVPASVEKVFVYATTSSTNARVDGCQTVNLNTLPSNGNPSRTYHTVTITSEYGVLNPAATGTKSEYSFVFVREGYDTENRLKTFTATTDADDTGMKVTFNQDNDTITITDVDPTASVLNVAVTKESSKSKVKIHNAQLDKLSTTVSIAWPDQTSGIFSFPITVTSEAGVDHTYTVKVSREAIKLNNVSTIESITILGFVDGNSEDHSPNMAGTFPFSKDIDGHTSTITVTAKLAAAAAGATIKIEYQDPNTSVWKPYSGSISPVGTGVTKIRVTSTAEDGTAGKEYIIQLNKEELSDDATVDKITIGGSDYTNPKPSSDPNSKPTEVPMNPGTTGTTIKPFPHDPNATVTMRPDGTGTITPNPSDPDAFDVTGLNPGPNKVIITVTPDDPTAPKKEYEVIIYVDEDTSLGDLSVTDHTFKSPFVSTDHSYEVAEKIAYTGEDAVEINFTLPTTVDHNLVKVTVDGKLVTTLTEDANGAWGASVTVPSTSSRTIPIVISQNSKTNKNTSTTYTVKIEKEVPKTDKDLLDITVAGQKIDSFSPATKSYVIVAPRNTPSITFSDIEVSPNATYVTNGTLSPNTIQTNPGVNTYTVSVYAESDTNKQTPNIYTFYVICAENDEAIRNIELVDVNGNPIPDMDNNTFTYNAADQNPVFNVASDVSSLYFKITRNGAYAYSSVDGTERNSTSNLYDSIVKTLAEGANTAEVYVLSELKYLLDNSSIALPAPALFLNGDTAVKESAHYNFTINRKKISNDATAADIDAYVKNDLSSPEKLNFADPRTDYIIENVGNAGNIGVYIKPNDSDATIIAPANVTLSASYPVGNGYYFYNWVLQGDASNNYLFTLDITIKASDGTTKPYKITASRSTIDKENDNTLVDISVTHQKQSNNMISFSASQQEYTVSIDDVGVNGVKHYTISAQNILGSLGKIYITDAAGNATQETSHTFNIEESMWGTTQTHKVYAISQNGDKGIEYTIKVEIEAPSEDNDLDSLKIDGGENLIGSVEFPYSMDVKNEKNSVTISAIAADEKASIEIILQDGTSKKGTSSINVPIDLVEGPNVMTIEVTAESGAKKRYTVTINRAMPMPKLLNLGVNGETLLDTNNVKVDFDPETLEYNVRVIHSHDTAEIFAVSSSPADHIYGTGLKPLQVGLNPFKVTIQNDSGNATEYTLNIYRYSEATMNCDVSEAWIEKFIGDEKIEIKEFREEFSPTKYLGYQYEISNKCDQLGVHFIPQQGEVPEFNLPAAKAEVFGADNLNPGLNNIVVVVTAPDGITQKMYYIAINKVGMNYEVNNKNYPDYSVEAVENEDKTYKVNIGSTKSVDVDFTKFIEDLIPIEDSNLKVTVLSNVEENPSEVILSVSDGDTTDIIKLKVESTGNPSKVDWMGLLPLWIGLALIILLLIIILICVNKDKFGKIAKKSDKKTDKKDKKEAEANENNSGK